MRGRRLRSICAALVVVIGLAAIVAMATGEVALVTTHGVSMEPRFHTGDLAVIVPSASYHVGEIVGYHSPLLDITVLHRIVAEHNGLFTFKGDNNSFKDPQALPPSAVKGRLWLHVPDGGTVLGWVRSPIVLGLLAFFLVALGIGQTARRRRRPGRATLPGSVDPGSAPATLGTGQTVTGTDRVGRETDRVGRETVRVGWWPIAVGLALVVVFGALTAVTWTRPTTRGSQSSVTFDQHVDFSYAALAPAGITYPTGVVTTGDPVFLHLVHSLDVTARYALNVTTRGASKAPVAVSGTIGATAVVEGPDGWSGPLGTVAPVAFSGSTATVDIPLDLTQIAVLEKAFGTETGIPLGNPNIVVTPTVHIHGTLDGAPVADTFDPSLTFPVNEQEIDVVQGGSVAGDHALTPDSPGSVERPTLVPAQMTILGRPVAVSEARRLALVGLILSILAAFGAVAWWMRRRRMDETGRIHAAFRPDLVAVTASPAIKAPLVVDVETFDELARLARRYDCMILEHTHDAGHAYYVESGATVYRCGVEFADGVLVSVDGPELAATISAQVGPADGVAAASDGTPIRGVRRRLRSNPSDKEADTARDDVDLLTLLARAELVSGVGDAGAHLREAIVLARKADLDEAMIEALLVNVRTSFDEEQQSDPEKIELLDYSLGLPGGAPARRARLLSALAVESIFLGASTRRVPILDEAREQARLSGDHKALIELSAAEFVARPRSTWSARQFMLDRPLFGQALDAALTLGDPLWVATTQANAAFCTFMAGDGEQLRAQVTALSATSAGGQNQIAQRSHLVLGHMLAVIEGRLADAETLSTEASDMRRMTGTAQTDKEGAISQFALRREQERLPELIPALTADVASRPPSAAAAAVVAFALVESDHRDDAAILLHRASHAGFGDIPDDIEWPLAVALWSEVAAYIGDRRAAADLCEILRPHDGIQMTSGGVGCGPASRLLANLEVLLGRSADADRHFAEAIAFSRALISPVWIARCQLDWAQTWLERGETAWAAQLTDEADATAGALALPALGRRWAALRDQLDRA